MSDLSRKELEGVKREINKGVTSLFQCRATINKEIEKRAKFERVEVARRKDKVKARRLSKILKMRTAGHTFKEIGSELGLHPATVGQHYNRRMRKMSRKPNYKSME
jgi:DNA-binding NarL/FixJ family response regulator